MIVPIFALANAGIEISEEFLARAATSPITLGIVAGYVLGKPIGIVGTAWLVSRLTRGRLRIFFINGRRQYGAYDIETLTAAVKTARAQAKLNLPYRPRA